MYATDFEYDGLTLSDFGMMIGSFSSPGMETLSSGADITFQTVRPVGSDRFRFYGASYEEAFSAVFQICRKPCGSASVSLTPPELSALQRWLCRKDGFHKLRFLADNYTDIYWNVVFSSKQISLGGQIVGLELTLHTDSPYAYRREQTLSWSLKPGESFSIYDLSDEIGFLYPTVTIAIPKGQQGKVELSNSMDKHTLLLSDLSSEEIITLDGQNKLIASLPERSDLPSRFNFHFPRICNTLTQRENVFTLSKDSVACTITFAYSPIIKTGI